MSSLIKAHGGTLVERILSPTEALALQERASQLETVTLDEDELLDLELLASGGASPLSGFMGQRDHRSVLDQQRLAGGALFPDTFVRDVREEARLVHGTDDPAHPGAARLLARPAGALGGEVALIRPRDLRFETAREVRLRL